MLFIHRVNFFFLFCLQSGVHSESVFSCQINYQISYLNSKVLNRHRLCIVEVLSFDLNAVFQHLYHFTKCQHSEGEEKKVKQI